MNITIEIFTGKDSEPYIETVSKLRIEVFKEYPYLYIGELDYERQYMSGYTKDDRAMIAIAKINNMIVGISTGTPFKGNSSITADINTTLLNNKIDSSKFYYYGEIIILPEYRGHGIITKLYSAQHELVKSWGYTHVCILTVVRDNDHPLKPVNYISPDNMWKHLGFERANITTQFDWPTTQSDGNVKNEKNALEFWIKDLSI